MKFAGIDMGFGDTKVYISGDGQVHKFKFPTAVAEAAFDGVDLGEFGSSDFDSYCFENLKYFVGEPAVQNAMPTRDIGFLFQYGQLILWHALKTYPDITTVAVGLPVGYFGRADEFKQKLRQLNVDGQTRSLNIHVFPQGVGVLYDWMFNDAGKRQNNLEDGITLDIGFNTVDVILIKDGKASSKLSGMEEGRGVCKITHALIGYIREKYDDTITEQEAKEVLFSGKFKLYGKVYNLEDIISRISRLYAEDLLEFVMKKWGNYIKRLDKVIIGGGGAYFLKDSIPEKLKGIVKITRENSSEYSNAGGFSKIIARAKNGTA